MNYEIILKNYQKGLWNRAMVALAVKKGVLTPDQYREITGENYS